MVAPRWTNGPASITLVRHGESVGNLADDRARKAKAEVLDLDERDADVELSPEWRDRLSRRTRVEEMAAVLRDTLD